ncbi:MAG: glycosyl transferase [Chitinophagaceae bacterium]|nr:MAG: glycosyl transferase [Chitinophagaceae bacterium]
MARSNIKRLLKDIKNFQAENYNLIISDFEPVSSWACYLKNIPCVALSNQAVIDLDQRVRNGKMNWLGRLILMRYAPGTSKYGFHFDPASENTYPPLIRPTVRAATTTDNGHITVYLPAYEDKKIIKHLSNFPETKFEVFSKHRSSEKGNDHITLLPLNNEKFIASMATSHGIICGAGFETPSEALFMGKKLLVIPMSDQYEQQINASVLEKMGVTVLQKLKTGRADIASWIINGKVVEVDYPDRTQEIVDRIVACHAVR